jgi:S-methylmethionine-dependent homocysteine/selenocysteine methylase
MTKDIVLMDGGMGQELIARSPNAPHPLWSAKVMLDAPELVLNVHRDFIAAGAKILTLNTYSATPERLSAYGFAEHFQELQALAYDLGRQAQAGTDARLAYSLPPLKASYTPELSPDFDHNLEQYQYLVDNSNPSIDLFICETMSGIAEGLAAATAGKNRDKEVWLAWSVRDSDPSLLRSGEPLAEAVEKAKATGVDAQLLNCSTPEATTQALPVVAGSGTPFGAYANGFTGIAALKPGGTVDVLKAREDLSPEAYTRHAIEWQNMGASVIGGCCEISPAHISHLAKALTSEGGSLKATL